MYYLLQWGQRFWVFSLAVMIFLVSFYLLIVTGLPPNHPVVKFLSLLPLGSYYKMQKVAYSSATSALGGTLAGALTTLLNAKVMINLGILAITGLGEILFKLVTLVPALSPLWIALGIFLTFLQFCGYLYFIYCVLLHQC